jgi:hypothetical protein
MVYSCERLILTHFGANAIFLTSRQVFMPWLFHMNTANMKTVWCQPVRQKSPKCEQFRPSQYHQAIEAYIHLRKSSPRINVQSTMNDIWISRSNQSGALEISIKLNVLYRTFWNIALQCSPRMKDDLITTVQYIITPIISRQCSIWRNKTIYSQGSTNPLVWSLMTNEIWRLITCKVFQFIR